MEHGHYKCMNAIQDNIRISMIAMDSYYFLNLEVSFPTFHSHSHLAYEVPPDIFLPKEGPSILLVFLLPYNPKCANSCLFLNSFVLNKDLFLTFICNPNPQMKSK